MAASTFTTNSTNITLGDAVQINIRSSSDNYTHALYLYFNGLTPIGYSIWNGSTKNLSATVNYTLEISRWIYQFNDGIVRSCYFELRTYDENGTLINPTSNKYFNLYLPENIVPSVTISAVDKMAGVTERFSNFVQLKSNLEISINAEGIYNSTIKSCKVKFEDSVYTNLYEIPHGSINGNGEIPITATVTDSRGRSKTETLNVKVLEYVPPKIKNFVAYRANSDGSQSENSTKINTEIEFEISPLNNLNNNDYKIYYKAKSAEEWSELGIEGNAYSLNTNFISYPVFALDAAYDVKFEITDYFGSSNVIVDIAEAYTLIDVNGSGRGMAFGKVSDWSDGVEFDIKTKFTNDVVRPVLDTGTDLNNLTTLTTFVLSSSNDYLNVPEENVNAILEIIGSTDDFILQRFKVVSKSSPKTYERTYDSEGWGEWVNPMSLNVYPVGSIYISANETNPGTLFGGTWEQIKDKFLLSAGSTYSEGEEGGAASYGLSVSHKHTAPIGYNSDAVGGININGTVSAGNGKAYRTANTDYSGSSLSSNVTAYYTANATVSATIPTLPPYLVVYVWKRTA